MAKAAHRVAMTAALLMLPASNAGAGAIPAHNLSSGLSVVPVASSNAHRPSGGSYGALKGIRPAPSFGDVVRRSNAAKPPFPSRFRSDTSRGNYGCHRFGKRAIDTDNSNWWARYRACREAGGD